MELILVSNKRNRTYRLPLGLLSVLFVGVLFLVMIAGTFHVGGRIAAYQAEVSYSELGEQKDKQWKLELEKQQASVNAAKRNAEKNLDALSARLSTLQAHLLRLDALGSRLISITNMSDIEFNMLESPGLGGPSPSLLKDQNSLGVIDFVEALQAIGQKIGDRSEKFSAIESMLMDSNTQSQVQPEGTPVIGGWTSSAFGWRTDPISGKKDFHEGVDLAGKSGSKVSSAAAGIVTWSGRNSGYGNMIEISHGNGYITRYAHNKENLVVVGDKVEKGQNIAVMGSSGRSTGPHVHFEVVHNGKHVNPRKFVSIH
ncbi:MAG: murein DD-endopeptidase MepM/ murein hydrolase activator NlpD [Gammaproteobacteria bacterium]|jgi:murein DD-endopeptidase MepM/ murein hydrolase activator NlpD